MKKNITKQNGYTLIETMIAVALFTIIVTLGMGALLNANVLHNKSKNMLSILDSLSFTMDDMSRNLRTGTNYYCIPNGGSPVYGSPLSGQSCIGVAFNAQDGSQWAYKLTAQGAIQKTTDGGVTWVQMTPSEAIMSTSIFPFSVLGAEPTTSGDKQQPFVVIHLVGSITYKTVVTPFSIQTSVSQRQIDI
jgi:prepilin-type N-terminal cleavage/methylation domain-containing protein